MKLFSQLVVAFLCAVPLSTVACSGGSGDPSTGDDQNFTGSKLSSDEQKSAKLDDNGICRTTCKDDSGKTLAGCRAGLFADPAFCSQDDNLCRKAATDANGICRNPDGKFAVGLCCTAMCKGARLTKDSSNPAQFHCRGTDGTFAPAACCNKLASGIPVSEVVD